MLFSLPFPSADGERLHMNQDMMALGMINVAGAFVAALPTSGAFSRTAVNIGSGVRSPISGLITPLTVLLAFYFWVDTFYYIPKAVLAGMIICNMWPLIDFQMPMELWMTNKSERGRETGDCPDLKFPNLIE